MGKEGKCFFYNSVKIDRLLARASAAPPARCIEVGRERPTSDSTGFQAIAE
jgi:hypothetical protein